MARISEKNKIYRTKEVMCHDIAEVLSSTTLSHGTKHSVIDHVIWVWSEFNGKYAGCQHWSEEAKILGANSKELVHEHLVPRKVIREKFLNYQNQILKQFKKFFKHIALAW